MSDRVHITLPERLRQFVDRQASQEGFHDSGDYVRAVLLREQEQLVRAQIDLKLLKALERPIRPVSAQDFQDIRRAARQRVSRTDISNV